MDEIDVKIGVGLFSIDIYGGHWNGAGLMGIFRSIWFV